MIKERPNNFIDLTGRKYGKLTVVSYSETRRKLIYWDCVCDCGNTSIVYGGSLKMGYSKSCGCNKIKYSTKIKSCHGLSGSRIYKIWCYMLDRCFNERKKDNFYKNWGGRGITVCDRWKDFANFYNDMKEGYADNLQIDRINNDGNYEPGNCRWATRSEQNRNRRGNRVIEYNGEIMIITDWAKRYNIPLSTLRQRISYGWTLHDALTKSPARIKKS